MDVHTRRRGLLAAVLLLALLEFSLRRFDLLSVFSDDTVPATFFAAINSQVIDAVRTLQGSSPEAGRPVVLMGNSQMDFGARPLPILREELVAAGAPPDTRVVPLFVYASTVTDAEVLSRSLGPLRPSVVVLGISAPDMGTTLEVARGTPVHRVLDTGFRDGPVAPGGLEARLDRWMGTLWRTWAQRSLYADLLFPPPGKRVVRSIADRADSEEDFLRRFAPEGSADRVIELRPRFERGDDPQAIAEYVGALQGPAYLDGLRNRWRHLAPQPVQCAALDTFARNVRAAGAVPVFLLVPENPLLDHDPVVGAVVRERSEEAAEAVRTAARAEDATVIDLRSGFGPERFLDLNHLVRQQGGLAPRLAREMANRGLLSRIS